MDASMVDNGDDIVAQARTAGYDLMQRELPSGELVWTFLPGDDTRHPCFVTRREAVAFIADRLRGTAVYATP